MYNLLLPFLFLSTMIFAQHDHSEEGHIHHDHHKNEIAVSNALVYFVGEKEFSYGLHAHYVRTFKKTRFGYGLAYERIFDDHKHSTYGIVFLYTPFDGLNFNVSPGITVEVENPQGAFAIHIESSYEFELGENIHIGPAVEFAYDPEDIHLSIGLHVGFGF